MGTAIDDIEIIGRSAAALVDTTNATTSYADVTGAAVVAAAVTEDPTQSATYGMFRITWAATLSKATATNGTLGLYVNGAIDTDTEVVVTSAQGVTRVSGSKLVARADKTAQTIKLQAKSGDTNVLTVSKAYIDVERVRLPGGIG